MEERHIDLYKEALTDAINVEQSETTESIKATITDLVRREGSGVAVNFALYTLYSTDKIAAGYIRNGFQTNGDKEFYFRLLLIEQDLEWCFDSLGYRDLFLKAVDVYRSATNSA